MTNDKRNPNDLNWSLPGSAPRRSLSRWERAGVRGKNATILFCALCLPLLAEEKPLYENNFEKTEVGKVPPEFLVLDGGFAVKEEAGNRFLELPGSPLESFGVQFGPTESSDLSVTARIKGTAQGRRYPTFGVGLNGVAGYKLQVSPAKKTLDL